MQYWDCGLFLSTQAFSIYMMTLRGAGGGGPKIQVIQYEKRTKIGEEGKKGMTPLFVIILL